MGHEKFEIYEDAGGKWRWRLKAANGSIIADSGQGYARKEDCDAGIALVIKLAPTADMQYLEK